MPHQCNSPVRLVTLPLRAVQKYAHGFGARSFRSCRNMAFLGARPAPGVPEDSHVGSLTQRMTFALGTRCAFFQVEPTPARAIARPPEKLDRGGAFRRFSFEVRFQPHKGAEMGLVLVREPPPALATPPQPGEFGLHFCVPDVDGAANGRLSSRSTLANCAYCPANVIRPGEGDPCSLSEGVRSRAWSVMARKRSRCSRMVAISSFGMAVLSGKKRLISLACDIVVRRPLCRKTALLSAAFWS